MKHAITLALAGLAISATAATAQVNDSRVTSSLTRQGFGNIEIEREDGQLKVEAWRGAQKIEIVYDLSTGEIVKQESEIVPGAPATRNARGPKDDHGRRGRGRGADDDDKDDRGRGRGSDDDSDDDSSGRGRGGDDHGKGGSRDDSDDDSRSDDSGRDDSGRDDSGRDDSGRDDSGRDDSDRDDSGRDDHGGRGRDGDDD